MKMESGVLNATKTDAQTQEDLNAQLRQRNAELELQVAEGKRLLREEMQRGNERTKLAIECRDKLDQMQAVIDAMVPQHEASGTVMISVPEVWKAIGGQADMQVTKARLLYELRLLRDVCDDIDDDDNGNPKPLVSQLTVSRQVAEKALELAFTDLAAKLETALRGEQSLSLPGHRRMSAHLEQLRGVRLNPYLDAAVSAAADQCEKDSPEN